MATARDWVKGQLVVPLAEVNLGPNAEVVKLMGEILDNGSLGYSASFHVLVRNAEIDAGSYNMRAQVSLGDFRVSQFGLYH